jgi:hypothetical protein
VTIELALAIWWVVTLLAIASAVYLTIVLVPREAWPLPQLGTHPRKAARR